MNAQDMLYLFKELECGEEIWDDVNLTIYIPIYNVPGRKDNQLVGVGIYYPDLRPWGSKAKLREEMEEWGDWAHFCEEYLPKLDKTAGTTKNDYGIARYFEVLYDSPSGVILTLAKMAMAYGWDEKKYGPGGVLTEADVCHLGVA